MLSTVGEIVRCDIVVPLKTNSITPPKAPVFDDTLSTDPAPASEEKGMSIPVIGSSEYLLAHHEKKNSESEEILEVRLFYTVRI